MGEILQFLTFSAKITKKYETEEAQKILDEINENIDILKNTGMSGLEALEYALGVAEKNYL